MKLGFGPGALVAAAFVGPGTVTACTLAGSNFGFALVWALVFATISTIILQDMAARLGAGAKLGLGEALMQSMETPALKWGAGLLVFAAIVVGNCAYEGGNIAGSVLGLEVIFAAESPNRAGLTLFVAFIAGLAILVGRYEILERLLVGLVLIMSIAFVCSAIVVRPDIVSLLKGLVPTIPQGATLTAIALIGTTIVPYNLFLHAAASRRKWHSEADVSLARSEAAYSIGLGGLVSILILSTAATILFKSGLEVQSAADMAVALEPAFGGDTARNLLGIGLFSAGLTSAITAPMATAFVLSELMGGEASRSSLIFRLTGLTVVLAGALIGLMGLKPVTMILVAQFANGLLLPLIASFLLFVMNRRDLLGEHVNSLRANILGGIVVFVTLALGLRAILRTLGVLG